uniref:SFRICE_034877 n=1 Tax=Spodoptera frugiperda TaxID=7108 RepID=A0A2H1WZA5_SPOFR
MPDEVFVSRIRSLNVQQKDLMKQVSDAIERDIRCNDDLQPLLLFITGGAGSGKSFLLKLIVEHIRRCYAPTVDILLKPTFVEVASLTGVAARQISGRQVEQSGEFADGAAMRIFPTLKLVESYNSKMTDQLHQSSRIYTLRAIDESREVATYGKRPPSNAIPTDVNNCGGLMHELKLGVGSRVMLRRNIYVAEGLVNGAMGMVSKSGLTFAAIKLNLASYQIPFL